MTSQADSRISRARIGWTAAYVKVAQEQARHVCHRSQARETAAYHARGQTSQTDSPVEQAQASQPANQLLLARRGANRSVHGDDQASKASKAKASKASKRAGQPRSLDHKLDSRISLSFARNQARRIAADSRIALSITSERDRQRTRAIRHKPAQPAKTSRGWRAGLCMAMIKQAKQSRQEREQDWVDDKLGG